MTEVTNLESLADAIGCKPQSIRKALFKGSECGITFDASETGVKVNGFAEGAQGECVPHELKYPFTMREFWDAAQAADDEGSELWDHVHYGGGL